MSAQLGLVAAAFYAPLKSPDHPVPSGDRRMARLLPRALRSAGFAPKVASHFRSLDSIGERTTQQRLMTEADHEAERLIGAYQAMPGGERPRLWLTYHCYYKAPDLLGPKVARALSIPYVIAEGSRAPKRRRGAWELSNHAAEQALDAASVIFVINEADRPMLEAARPPSQVLLELPPFIEDAVAVSRPRPSGQAPRLLTVAMMRRGDKLASYHLLADALLRIAGRPWSLTVVGDGEARPDIEEALSPLGARTTFLGLVEDAERLARLYAGHDLLVWPAVNEAYGMVLLEAQQQGCPVVAGRFGGVPNVVRDGETGLLSPPGDAAAFAHAVATLLDDGKRRDLMGRAARAFVNGERTVGHAAEILRRALLPLVAVPA